MFRTRRRVEFSDTDMAGICHFARFLTLMESVEHEFWRSLGVSVMSEFNADRIGWPRLAVSCEYLKPCNFEDVLDISLRVARIGNKSMTFDFEFSREGEAVARGQVKTACCISNPGEPLRPIPIPEGIRERLQEYLPE